MRKPVPLRYIHLDVFAPRPFSGNSLAVFPDAAGLSAAQMLAITQELRHFESIFLEPAGPDGRYRARVFDLMGELDFAGHPVIGAACAVHSISRPAATARWTLELPARAVTVETSQQAGVFSAVLDQGPAEFLHDPPPASFGDIAAWFSLAPSDLHPRCPPQVVSTGLRYLILPVQDEALARARIAIPDLEARLAALQAQFAYLLAPDGLEGRHWNNDGLVEDVATGSGAGCVAAYLREHGRLGDGEIATLRQGRFVGRPSEIQIRAHGEGRAVRSVEVGGSVVVVGRGELERAP